MFEVKNHQELELGVHVHKYDLEEYYLPPIMRRVLKTTKQGEIVQIRSSRRDKIVPYFEDPQGVFKRDLLSSFTKEVVITFCLIAYE